jgi:hypothetical protein
VQDGGLLLSDVEAGLMDGHARWQAAGRLDDVLGVQRIQLRSAADSAPAVKFRVALSGGPAEFDVVPADPKLRITTGQPGAAAGAASDGSAGEALFLIDNRYGSGRSITFNLWMADYERLRKSDSQAARLDLLRDYLSLAGVRPVAEVRRASGGYLACSEIVAFRKRTVRFLSILPEPDCADAGMVTLNLSGPAYVYDLRAHRLMGRISRVSGRLVPGEPLLYGILPSPLGRLSVSLAGPPKAPAQVKAGDIAKFSIHLSARNGAGVPSRQLPGGIPEPSPESAVHVEVRNPAGKTLDYYTANLPLVNSAAEFSIPLALDDVPGPWRVTVREPYAHQSASATFTVTR